MWLANDMTYKKTKHTTNTTKSVCIQCMVAHTVLLAVGVPTNTTFELYTDIVRLTNIYGVNFLAEEAVRKAGDKLHLVDMDKVTLYENLSIGDETWLYISALEEEMDTKPFLCVKTFYSATLQKFYFHLATQFYKIWVLSNQQRQSLTLYLPLRGLPRGFLRLS